MHGVYHFKPLMFWSYMQTPINDDLWPLLYMSVFIISVNNTFNMIVELPLLYIFLNLLQWSLSKRITLIKVEENWE